jgi:hypothetical protein
MSDLAKASDIKGTLSVPDVAHPQVNFEVSASELDIDKLMAVANNSKDCSWRDRSEALWQSFDRRPRERDFIDTSL